MNCIPLCSFTVVGVLLGILWFCGILLHPVGTKTGNPATPCLLAQSHHTQSHCGNVTSKFQIYEKDVTVQAEISVKIVLNCTLKKKSTLIGCFNP